MKGFILLLFFAIFNSNVFSQDVRSLKKCVLINDTLYLTEIISRGSSLLGVTENTDAAYIRSFKLSERHKPVYTNLFISTESPKYNFPICWDIYKKNVYVVGFSEGNRSRASSSIFRTPVNFIDTIELKSDLKSERNKLETLYPKKDERERRISELLNEQAKQRNERIITPLIEKIKSIEGKNRDGQLRYGELSYDLVVINKGLIYFFVRDKNEIVQWKYLYPQQGMSFDNEWQVLTKYSSDSTSKDYSIYDPSILNGDFKVIRQGDNFFFVNTSDGKIYHLGHRITKVGQIQLSGYRKILEQVMFIEDRDAETMIFMAPVEKVGEPFPKVRMVLSDKELREVFGNAY